MAEAIEVDDEDARPHDGFGRINAATHIAGDTPAVRHLCEAIGEVQKLFKGYVAIVLGKLRAEAAVGGSETLSAIVDLRIRTRLTSADLMMDDGGAESFEMQRTVSIEGGLHEKVEDFSRRVLVLAEA